MADFIELTRYDGVKILVGTDHIVEVVPDTDGTFFDKPEVEIEYITGYVNK